MYKNVALHIKDLTFFFPKNNIPFFYKMNVNFQPNVLNFIQGKNGVGKSTLLRIMSGEFLSQERVTGTLHSDNIIYDFEKPREVRQAIRMVTQNFNDMLLDTYSFNKNLQCALLGTIPKLKGLPQYPTVPAFVEKYGINTEIPISALSGGQRQILSILMTMQKSPKIVLLDEPTAAMDEENAKLIMDFLTELSARECITIILIVHQKELIKKYSKNSYYDLIKDANETRQLVLRTF